jgi:tRNA (adenine22-N1)-methyltransferase
MVKLANPRLSPRMKIFLHYSQKGQPFWDICCDHGYVGIGALKSGEFGVVHFVDQVPHIIERIRQLMSQSHNYQSENGKKENVHYFYHSLPGETIDRDVFGTILIAGVGGLTIKNILSALLQKERCKAERILLSPHTDEAVMVNFISSEYFLKYYELSEKVLITENKKERPLYILITKKNLG